jgi:hypothetical protein
MSKRYKYEMLFSLFDIFLSADAKLLYSQLNFSDVPLEFLMRKKRESEGEGVFYHMNEIILDKK